MMRLLEYVLVRVLLAFLRSLSYPASLRLAAAIPSLVFRLNATPRDRALSHLSLAYGQALGEGERERIARGVFSTMSRHIAEVAQMTRQAVRGLRIEHPEILTESYAHGRGVVLVSAHMGCFARMAVLPRLLGVRAAVIMKKQRNDALLRWSIRFLKRNFDLEVIRKQEARPRAVNMLREGFVVVFFSDQHASKRGFSTRFFGRPVTAVAGPAVYAKRLDCPLVVVTAVVERDGTHVLRFDGPVSTEGSHEEITQRWLDLLEARIRCYPEQWMWMHRRWRETGRQGA
jgi:KDO2-lipid IV(A) lauroyltransferase